MERGLGGGNLSSHGMRGNHILPFKPVSSRNRDVYGLSNSGITPIRRSGRPVGGVAVAVGGCGAGVVDAGWGDELGRRWYARGRDTVIKDGTGDGNAHVLVPCMLLLTTAPGWMGALQVLACLCGRQVGRKWKRGMHTRGAQLENLVDRLNVD